MLAHSVDKYINSTMHQTSNAQGWSNMLAERWSHASGELPRIVPQHTEVAIQLRGRSLVDRKGGGRAERTRGGKGTIWICPAGVEEEYVHVAEPIADCLHLFLPSQPISDALSRDLDIDARHIGLRYQAIERDPFIEVVADQILNELTNESGVGKLLVESLSIALGAHLIKHYAEQRTTVHEVAVSTRPLEQRRLAKVLDFIHAQLDQDFTVTALSEIACMSVAHFTRSFRAATGQSPHAFVLNLRIEQAKRSLLDSHHVIEDIALSAGFSSQANFTKAFRRATGITPGQFRQRQSA